MLPLVNGTPLTALIAWSKRATASATTRSVRNIKLVDIGRGQTLSLGKWRTETTGIFSQPRRRKSFARHFPGPVGLPCSSFCRNTGKHCEFGSNLRRNYHRLHRIGNRWEKVVQIVEQNPSLFKLCKVFACPFARQIVIIPRKTVQIDINDIIVCFGEQVTRIGSGSSIGSSIRSSPFPPLSPPGVCGLSETHPVKRIPISKVISKKNFFMVPSKRRVKDYQKTGNL